MTEVLIVGAGPTGLVLALSLAQRGVPFRIIDAKAGPGEHSRAMVLQARTLEFYDQLGIAAAVIERGIRVTEGHLREGGEPGIEREIASFSLHDIGKGLSPYPFALVYPQDEHERFLIETLAKRGITIEWNTALETFSQDEHAVHATLKRADGVCEPFEAAYICGCDGADSRVRHTLGLGFAGGTYEQLFYVADAEIAGGFKRDLYINLGQDMFALMLPVRSSGMQRLIGLIPRELSHDHDVTFEEIRVQVERLLGERIANVNWFSVYRVHHRVAERFRVGRAFLLGDAGHIHSPAGGQGMNTGIGDAVNLGWKLADVLCSGASVALLETYEAERFPFARALVATTDRLFSSIVAGGAAGAFMRRVVAPLALSVGTRFAMSRRAFFRTISQISIRYQKSALSVGTAGEISGGDRLPWAQVDEGVGNFAALRSREWQIHIYGAAGENIRRFCRERRLCLKNYAWTDAARGTGLKRHAVYAVRPDGYIGFADGSQSVDALDGYFKTIGVRSFGDRD